MAHGKRMVSASVVTAHRIPSRAAYSRFHSLPRARKDIFQSEHHHGRERISPGFRVPRYEFLQNADGLRCPPAITAVAFAVPKAFNTPFT